MGSSVVFDQILGQEPAVRTLIRALSEKGLFQSLAEPNLIATNGKEASFLAGGEYPYPVVQLAHVLKRHPKTTVIWAHCGLGRIVHPVADQVGMVARALANPELAHVQFDISWDETAKYLVASPESIQAVAAMINRHPDRFLFGTDEVGPTDPEKYLKVYDIYAPLLAQLKPDARGKLLKGGELDIEETARMVVRDYQHGKLVL